METTISCPYDGLAIGLCPAVSDGDKLDFHMFSPATRGKRKSVRTTLSELGREDQKSFWTTWGSAMNRVLEYVKGPGKDDHKQHEFAAEELHFRDVNKIEVDVERVYDSQVDCSIWRVISVRVNDVERAGVLEDLLVGIDVDVRICFFPFMFTRGVLGFLDEPSISSGWSSAVSTYGTGRACWAMQSSI